MPDPDPKGLIAEAFRMEGLSPEDCRVIFLQWAMQAPDSGPEALKALLDRHGTDHPDHELIRLIAAGLAGPGAKNAARRRRGRARRSL